MTPEHVAATVEGRRMAKLYRLTDPLWKAIALGRKQEAAKLQQDLAQLVARDQVKHDKR
jgi:predicted alpha-1,6-mannanase (GH76 family)